MGSACRRRTTIERPSSCARSSASGGRLSSGRPVSWFGTMWPVRANQKFEIS
jgi:hypothetical protein